MRLRFYPSAGTVLYMMTNTKPSTKFSVTREYFADLIEQAHACAHLAEFSSSAMLCAEDAGDLYAKGDIEAAYQRAKKSLRYSLGFGASAL